MELLIRADGVGECIYDETFDLTPLGQLQIRRASHVEPDDQSQWQADLSPAGGPILGPFATRSAALAAEIAWLEANWLGRESA